MIVTSVPNYFKRIEEKITVFNFIMSKENSLEIFLLHFRNFLMEKLNVGGEKLLKIKENV